MIRPWRCLSLVVMSVCAAGFVFSQAPQSSGGARQDRHALLVGVTFYETLPKAKHLVGPGNDVALVRKLLLDKFQFDPRHIVVLSEADGASHGMDFYPTRANIEREFKRLALVARSGDQVVIHMGGHGSQQPEDKKSPDPEPDGLDEIFLPRDVGPWDGSKGTVKNAIIDDEVGAWLKAILDKKASVWITFDSCHSGTMIRGGDDSEKARDLDPVDDLGVPRQAIKEAVEFAAKRDAGNPEGSRGGDPPPAFKMAKEGGVVAIYACQPNEVTYERELPKGNKEGKVYGLLSFAICKTLTEAAEKSKEPITYNELARRIQGQYVQWGRTAPTPLIEGVDRDRQVLGDKVWPGRSSIMLAESNDGLQINAGALHGLTEGTILAVTPPPGMGDKLLGHVRIRDLRVYNANVEPCAHGKEALNKSLPEGAVCKPVFIDMGDQQLKVAVDPIDAFAKAAPEATRAEVEKVLKGLAGLESLVRPIDKTSQADWVVRLQGKEVVLVPGAGWSKDRSPNGAARFGPAAIDANLGPWLKDRLGRIARAENLKRLAAGGESGDADQAIRVDLNMKRKKDQLDTFGSIPVEWPAPEIVAYDGDRMVCKITNKGRVPVDVTVLYVDSGYGVGCLYPKVGDLNRLRPGDFESSTIRFKNNTAGMEQLIVIAVKSPKGTPADYSALVQSPLELAPKSAAIERDPGLNSPLETPLGKLLKRGMFGQGQSRGAATEEMDDYRMYAVFFNVRPQKRPTPK